MKLRIDSLGQTETLARIIAKLVRPRDMIVLSGEMGAGKTTFTQGLGKAMGVTETITSPTFNLLHNYRSRRLALHHADLFRLERTGELVDLGLDELQDAGGVVVVEWGDVVGDELGDALVVSFSHGDAVIDEPGEQTTESRLITIEPRGVQWLGRMQKLGDELSRSFKVLARG